MAVKLRAAKLYKVEFGKEHFAHQQWEVNELLGRLCPEAVWNVDIPAFADEVEITRCELQEAVRRIREMPNDDFYMIVPDCDKEQFADTLQEVLNEADPYNDFIKLYWF